MYRKTYLFEESGIAVEDGSIKTGTILEIAKHAKMLYEENKLLEFERYVFSEADKLNKEDRKILMCTRLSESSSRDILSILGDIDYLKYGNDDYVLTESGMVPRE